MKIQCLPQLSRRNRYVRFWSSIITSAGYALISYNIFISHSLWYTWEYSGTFGLFILPLQVCQTQFGSRAMTYLQRLSKCVNNFSFMNASLLKILHCACTPFSNLVSMSLAIIMMTMVIPQSEHATLPPIGYNVMAYVHNMFHIFCFERSFIYWKYFVKL